LKSYKLNGLWVIDGEVEDKKTPIGMCGFLKRITWNLRISDLLFYQNLQGKALDLKFPAPFDYGASILNLSKIMAITVPKNIISIKLLQKIGMQFISKLSLSVSHEEFLLFSKIAVIPSLPASRQWIF
jgi:ribosomal-protein-alanine N-acetyltransferase